MAKKARLRYEIVQVQERIKRTARLNNKRRNSTTLAVLHDEGEFGQQWCGFIQNMFTEELPEECRDMNLDVITESVTFIGEDDVCNINNCEYKLLLLTADVLKLVRNEESTLRRCELLETQPEQLIVLIIGKEDDVEFLQSANSAMYGLKGHEAFSIIQAKYPDQIFSDIMMILSPMYVVPHPNILSSEDKDQHLTLISNKPFPVAQEVEYVIEFSVGRKTKETTASLFNPCTLLVPNPGHPPGVVTVRILVCTRNPHTEDKVPEITRTQMGEDMKVWFQSDMDRVYSVLESQTNPMQFLCQAMNISNRRDDSNRSVEEKIDKLLTESFKRCVPDNKLPLVFGDLQHFDEHDQDGNRSEYVPTLLHFSAMYGLRDLTAALLQCPGAVQAYGTANCDGDYPTNLAEKSGHWDLRDFMETYMEVAAMVDRDLANEGSLQTSQIMSDMVQGQYLSFGGDIGISEDIYCRMEDAGKVNSLPLPSGYVHMKSLVDAPATSVDYDSMIEKMLKETLIEDNEKEYETMDFAPFPLPPRQRHEERVQLQDEAPPPPPPRDDKFPMKLKNDCEGSRPDDETILMLPKLPTNLSSAQEELIALQRKVKNNELTINQAVFRFKEWERKHKERAASFQYQQESLQRIRNSLMRGRERRKQEGKSTSIRISEPITVATSTYDKVLLKTRKEVMVENAYGGLEKIKEGKESSERIEPARTNLDNSTGNAYTVDAQSSFNRARSFKQRFGRPPMSLPDERTGSTLSRLGSQGSTNSSSSRSSNRSTGNFPFPSSFDSAQVAPPLPRGPRGSIPDRIQQPWPSDLHSQEVEPDSFRPHRGSFDAPPPIPPRDGPPARYGPGASRHHSIAGTLDARPDIPPRNPRYR